MNPSLLPPDSINRTLESLRWIERAAEGNIGSKAFADLVARAADFDRLASQMDTMLASQRRLLSQVDFSGLILAETVLKKLDTRVLSANLRLMQPVDASSIELARRAVASLVPTTELISDFQFRMDELSRWIDISICPERWPPLNGSLSARAVPRKFVMLLSTTAYGTRPQWMNHLLEKSSTVTNGGVSSGAVNSIVSRYYARDNWMRLDDILTACEENPRLEKRVESVRQALHAHREGHYLVTVPTLLLLVEGIAADYVKANNLMPKIGQQTTEIITTALKETPCSPFDLYIYAGVTALLVYIEHSMYTFVDFDQEHDRLLREKSSSRTQSGTGGRRPIIPA